VKLAHLTTVDLSLRFLVFPQLLAARDAGLEVIGLSSPGPWVTELETAGLRHVALPSSTRGVSPLGDLRAAIEFWRAMRHERPAILHTHNPKPGVYGRVLGRLAGVPVVVNTVHGLYATADDPFIKRGVVYGLEAVASRFSDRELVQSREDLELICRLHLAPQGHASHLGNGIDLKRFDPSAVHPGRRNEVRAQLGLDADTVCIGIVGRLVAEKGYLELFEAARRFEERFRLVVIGPDDPDKPDALPRQAVEEAAASGVLFLGMRTDMEDLYSAMDVFVLPSHREGFPRSAMEAAAMAIPIVATDIRGCRDVVVDGVNGFLVPVGSPSALVEAIRRLEDPALRQQMGAAGRRKAMREFDENVVIRRVLAAYQEVAVEKGLADLIASLSSRRVVTQRRARRSEAAVVARLHMDSIDGGFLPSLGHRFMTLLYRAMTEWPQSVVVVGDAGAGPVGFVSGVLTTRGFYRYFLRRYGVQAALSALPALWRPAVLRRAFETLRYGQAGPDGAELLAMAIHPGWRRQGLGAALGERFLSSVREGGADKVRVVVGSDNAAAIAAYEKLGFVDTGGIEVHEGEPSRELTWSA
jgi:glycosyltransferase involved in cell wall biosynthesis/ribosomal protein S18 acetylase RimI-like enzyme